MRMDMKMEKMSQKALERKCNKPIMEKKRRARINTCLNQLKALILEADNERSRHSKLEKADILEMTVKYLQTFRTYHVHLQQLQQLQQQSSQQQLQQRFQQQILGTSKLQQQQLSPSSTLSSDSSTPPMNLQLPQLSLPLPLRLSLQAAVATDATNGLHLQSSPEVSPNQSSNSPQYRHHLQHAHQNHQHHLSQQHLEQQISPTWRPW